MTAGDITRDLVTLKKQLPPSDFAAIKQEAFLNLVDDVSSEGVDGVTFSGTKFLTKWSKMKKLRVNVMCYHVMSVFSLSLADME